MITTKLNEACELFGIAKDVARDAKFVSGKIESAGRTAQLSFGHHKAVAGRHDAGELLA